MVESEQLIVDFVNTLHLDREGETLQTPGDLIAWLRAHGLRPGARATAGDLEDARALREALRDVLGSHNELDADLRRASRIFDETARRARLELRFADGRTVVEPAARGVAAALGRIVVAVSETMAAGTWERLKACRREGCRWAFYDTAKNHSRAWCSMQSCGNRAKVQAFRDRQRA
jgi:predicted RNA-binding Zn ribbon-like protein